MMALLITLIISNAIVSMLCVYYLFKYVRLRREKKSEYYTDYTYKTLTMRVFKPEFEFQALGKTPIEKILDRGSLSPAYCWALIELNN